MEFVDFMAKLYQNPGCIIIKNIPRHALRDEFYTLCMHGTDPSMGLAWAVIHASLCDLFKPIDPSVFMEYHRGCRVCKLDKK
jgi:hypothetical protein